jgi:capsular exopolysaccharide synthesis family protein
MQELVEALIRRRILFLVPAVVVAAASLVIGLLLPKTYEASSIVQVRHRQIIDPLVTGLAVPPDIREEFDTLSKQITTWPRLEQLVAQLHLADTLASPREREDFLVALRERVTVRIKSKDMLEIVYGDHDPRIAQQVANVLTQNFIDENARIGKEEARNAIDFIGGQLKIYQEKLESSQQDFSLNKITVGLHVARNRRTLLAERLRTLQRIIPSQITTAQSPLISQMQARLGQLEAELSRLMLDAKDGNPRVDVLRREIAGIEERINQELEKRTVRESVSTFNPLYLQAEQELRQVEMEIRSLEKRSSELAAADNGGQRAISEEKLGTLEQNTRVDEDIYQMFLRQMESAYVSERLQDSGKGNRFAIIEYARLPLKPTKPNLPKIILMGLADGLLAGLGCVLAAENVARAFQTVDQVREQLEIPSLGTVSRIVPESSGELSLAAEIREMINRSLLKNPMLSKMRFVAPHTARRVLKSGVSPQVVIHHEPECRVSEEFRVIRTNLRHGLDRTPRTILVTSTLRGEGKSTTCANLAIAMADGGHKTLLMDCDLRRGSVHELFALPRTPGLTDLLTGECRREQALRQTVIKNLCVMPCGAKHLRPSELLGLPAMEDLLGDLKKMFDVILLDAPPVLNLPDPCVLSKYGDCVVMVVQSGRAKRRDVAAARGLLAQVNARLSGFVMTNVQYYMPKYVYDYYYEN